MSLFSNICVVLYNRSDYRESENIIENCKKQLKENIRVLKQLSFNNIVILIEKNKGSSEIIKEFQRDVEINYWNNFINTFNSIKKVFPNIDYIFCFPINISLTEEMDIPEIVRNHIIKKSLLTLDVHDSHVSNLFYVVQREHSDVRPSYMKLITLSSNRTNSDFKVPVSIANKYSPICIDSTIQPSGVFLATASIFKERDDEDLYRNFDNSLPILAIDYIQELCETSDHIYLHYTSMKST